MRRRVAGFALSSTLLACACGATKTDGAACNELVTAICNKVNECQPVAIKTVYKDVDDCVARQRLGCTKSFADPSTGLSADYASACASAYRAASCESLRVPPDACRPPAGGLAAGAACGEDAQCASRRCSKDRSCGVCGDGDHGEGDGCAIPAQCRDGLVCSGSKCSVPLKAGEQCWYDPGEPVRPPCGGGLVCHATRGCVEPDFVPCGPVTIGDPTHIVECSAGTLAGPGATCGRGAVCAESGTCPGSSDGIASCIAQAEDGTSCDPDHADGPNGHCKPPAQCVDGRCAIVAPADCH